MMYVDENLCTGCGLCVDACEQQAISLRGNLATIDASACTGCGRCAPVCMTGALESSEIVLPGPPLYAPGRSTQVPLVRPGAPFAPEYGVVRPTSLARPSAPYPAVRPPLFGGSKLQLAEKLLSGLFSAITFAIDQKGGMSVMGTGSGARANGRCASGSGAGALGRRHLGAGGGGRRFRGK
jgi:ferredoxin